MSKGIAGVFGLRRSRDGGEHWLTISDLMAGLMMVFLLISIALMRNAFVDRDRMREVAVAYQDGRVALGEALCREFEDDLEEWEARCDREEIVFEFISPEVLFPVGSAELRFRFEEILDDFFPRYLEVLLNHEENGNAKITEIRIEGHTSSEWTFQTPQEEAYLLNMDLSQGRTRSVLDHVLNLENNEERREWTRSRIAAIGFSSSRLELDPVTGKEDAERSRRVLFRVVTDADTQIRRILEPES